AALRVNQVRNPQAELERDLRENGRERCGDAVEGVVIVVEDDHVPGRPEPRARAGVAPLARLRHDVSHSRSSVCRLGCTPRSSSPRSSPTVPWRSATTSWLWIVSKFSCREQAKSPPGSCGKLSSVD